MPQINPLQGDRGMGIKPLGMIIGGVIVMVLGVGAYFMFFDKPSSGLSSLGLPTSKSTGSLKCRDLLPDNKFQQITGKNPADYELIQQGEGLAVAGLNALPGHEGAGDQVVEAGVKQVICSYVDPKNKRSSVGAMVGQLLYIITWSNYSAEEAFNSEIKWQTEYAGEKVGGGGINTTYPPAPTIVSGLGATAAWYDDRLTVLSTDKKYSITLGVERDEDGNILTTHDMVEAVAREIDGNL